MRKFANFVRLYFPHADTITLTFFNQILSRSKIIVYGNCSLDRYSRFSFPKRIICTDFIKLGGNFSEFSAPLLKMRRTIALFQYVVSYHFAIYMRHITGGIVEGLLQKLAHDKFFFKYLFFIRQVFMIACLHALL